MMIFLREYGSLLYYESQGGEERENEWGVAETRQCQSTYSIKGNREWSFYKRSNKSGQVLRKWPLHRTVKAPSVRRHLTIVLA